MNKYLIALAAVVVFLLGAAFGILAQPGQLFSAAGVGPTHYQAENFLQGLYAGTKGQFKVSNTGAITMTNTSSVNIIPGTLVTNNFVQASAGFSLTITATTTLTAAQFCASTGIRVANTTSTITITLPAATSTYLACGSPTAGSWSSQLIVNDSTNTVLVAAGTGTKLLNYTVGNGTTTNSGTNTISATSSQLVIGQWLSSSSLYIYQGPHYH